MKFPSKVPIRIEPAHNNQRIGQKMFAVQIAVCQLQGACLQINHGWIVTIVGMRFKRLYECGLSFCCPAVVCIMVSFLLLLIIGECQLRLNWGFCFVQRLYKFTFWSTTNDFCEKLCWSIPVAHITRLCGKEWCFVGHCCAFSFLFAPWQSEAQ